MMVFVSSLVHAQQEDTIVDVQRTNTTEVQSLLEKLNKLNGTYQCSDGYMGRENSHFIFKRSIAGCTNEGRYGQGFFHISDQGMSYCELYWQPHNSEGFSFIFEGNNINVRSTTNKIRSVGCVKATETTTPNICTDRRCVPAGDNCVIYLRNQVAELENKRRQKVAPVDCSTKTIVPVDASSEGAPPAVAPAVQQQEGVINQ